MVEQESKTDLLKQVPSVAWERLGQMRILFGHQSVGFNIIDGIRDVMKDNPTIKLNIVEIKAPTGTLGPAFAHFRVGKNGEPNVKIDDFARYVNEAGGGPDIAFFKFCFADANAGTDVRAVFNHYRQVLSDLETRHPRTMFVHVTMALTTIQTGWRVPIKRLLGRPIDGYADNATRNQYNDLLRAQYAGKAPFIDLAAIESTFPDGSRMSFGQDGETYYAMAPGNTSDGGHLSQRGRRVVAEQLLALLAELTRKQG